ncbi:HD-GYP domain-containing protein [Paenibacillus maysiensis]|uniref:HD-GYP domain-containing protein n=1 Tax=Paenibacillus maysiensis TaxID=1155954 RepID=UPI00047121F9|nr:HD domain-containing phosphohydrolase [Paenibacillus maysiensis]
MPIYKRFIQHVILNYIIGSFIAVLLVGAIFVFSTLNVARYEFLGLMKIIAFSSIIMIACETLVFRMHLGPVRHFFLDKRTTFEDVEAMYIRIHRLPNLSVLRIMGPHLLGFSIPAAGMAIWMIHTRQLTLPFYYVGIACVGACLVASMHAMIEFFLTMRAIRPLLVEIRDRTYQKYGINLSLRGRVLLSLRHKFQLSATLIGAFPLFLFCLATQIRLERLDETLSNSYWVWAGTILLFGVAFAYLGGWLLTREIEQPIHHLLEKMNEVKEGCLNDKASDLYSDEFAKLIEGFNIMVEGLKEREDKNSQLQESYFATLAAALDARDAYTAGHSLRVAEYSVIIGRRGGLNETDLDLLRKTALLHDIGKIGVADAVLFKDGKLTDEEFDQIKMHPVMGESILRQVEPAYAMAPYLPGVRSHHERYDGKGYPDQLRGEDIPLFGRIIAVADAYDAMTSDRPYRKGMPKEKAVMILEEGKGTQWDPYFAELFVEEWRRNKGIMS